MHTKVWRENLRVVTTGSLGVNGTMILKLFLKEIKRCEVDSSGSGYVRVGGVVNTVMNCGALKMAGMSWVKVKCKVVPVLN
jgi:hypothetical protein